MNDGVNSLTLAYRPQVFLHAGAMPSKPFICLATASGLVNQSLHFGHLNDRVAPHVKLFLACRLASWSRPKVFPHLTHPKRREES